MDRTKPCAKCQRLIYASAWHTCPDESCCHHIPCRAAPPPPAEQASGEYVASRLDEATYQKIEAALDRAEAPARDASGRWLSLTERVAALSQRPVVDGWSLCIRQSERDKKPAVWATDGSSYVWVADLAPQQPEKGEAP